MSKRKLDFRIEYQQQFESSVTYIWFLCSDGNGVMHGAKMTTFCEEFFGWCREKGIAVEPKVSNPAPYPVPSECMQPLESVAETESLEKIGYLF
jgi:hypothetical protein